MVSEEILPASLSLAKAAGSKYYNTGRPCIHGHLAKRKTSTRACVECARLRTLLASRRKRANPEYAAKEKVKNRERAAFLRATSPEYVEAVNEANRVYAQRRRDTDPAYVERTNALRRALWENDAAFRDRTNAYVRQWLSENPERKKAIGQNRRSLEIGAEGTFTAEELAEIHESQGYCCAFCGVDTKVSFHVDHIIPLSRGGSNWPSNLQVLCAPCNLRKSDKTPEEYFAMIAANDNYAQIRRHDLK